MKRTLKTRNITHMLHTGTHILGQLARRLVHEKGKAGKNLWTFVFFAVEG